MGAEFVVELIDGDDRCYDAPRKKEPIVDCHGRGIRNVDATY
jgi:hypothetical protein